MKKIAQTLKRPWSWIGAAVLLGTATYAGIAYAGTTANYPVGCDGSLCHGALGSARNSSNSVEYIGCAYVAGCFYNVCDFTQCSARDAAGDELSCSSSNPKFLAALGMMNSDSLITFACDGPGGTLNLLRVETSSQYTVKNHDRYLP